MMSAEVVGCDKAVGLGRNVDVFAALSLSRMRAPSSSSLLLLSSLISTTSVEGSLAGAFEIDVAAAVGDMEWSFEVAPGSE